MEALTKRPPLPQPIAWLYVIAILVTVLAAIAAGWAITQFGFPAAANFVGVMAGSAIAAFIPALLGHGVVTAVHDLQWRRKSWLD